MLILLTVCQEYTRTLKSKRMCQKSNWRTFQRRVKSKKSPKPSRVHSRKQFCIELHSLYFHNGARDMAPWCALRPISLNWSCIRVRSLSMMIYGCSPPHLPKPINTLYVLLRFSIFRFAPVITYEKTVILRFKPRFFSNYPTRHSNHGIK